MAETSNDKVNLLDYLKKGTQKYILGEIFNEQQGNLIFKRNIEKYQGLRWSLRKLSDIDIKSISSIDELISQAEDVPGDLQRNIRLFYDTFRKYGMEKKEKDEDGPLSYKWNPILKSQLENIVHPAARNLFKTQEQLDTFCASKNNKCEMCGKTNTDNDTLRMAIDHWRAHSVYNIDDDGIAVLLCETCNNIHHNYDASKIAYKYIDNIKLIKNWVKKEKEIRDLGFLPNESDLQKQKDIIKEITEYHNNINPILHNFWEGLI
jgi:hypothetical protein